MPLHSTIDPKSSEFARNADVMRGLVAELRDKLKVVSGGGGEVSRKRHTSRGKMLARERVDLLVDPGTAFLELSPLAAHGLYGGDVHSASVITGVGRISGRECVIVANDATIKGGTYYPLTVKKHLRAQDIARQNNLPCVYMVDSGGAFLPMQDEIFPDERHFGRIFYNQAQMSSQGIPQIADRDGLLHRRRRLCAGDVGREHHRAQSGHDLPRRPAAGEGRDRRGRDRRRTRRRRRAFAAVRRHRSLCAERRACDRHCPAHRRDAEAADARRRSNMREPREPLFPADEIYGVVSADGRKPFDVHDIIARMVDGSEFDEFKKLYGTTLICGFAHIWGYPVGIIANNGILFSESSLKGAHFIELCCQRNIPLVFLQNITGFMVGKKYEAGGIARDGAKLVTAVATAGVPKFTVVIGGSYGAGNYGMCGRAYSPRFLWMWPNARISVMGGEQASMVLSQVRRDNIEAKGDTWSAEEEDKFRAPIRAQYESQGNPYYATARLWDDGVIDPADTRLVLGLGLSAAANAPIEPTKFGLFRM